MTERGTWKASERRMAEALGGVRVPVTGRQRGSAPDIAHEVYAIEQNGCAKMSGTAALVTPRPVSPEVSPMLPHVTTAVRFWSKVEVGDDSRLGHCLVWTGARQPRGYGMFRFNGKTALAHRVAFEMATGAPPSGELDHLCRNHSCVRVDHLEDVSHRENVLRGTAPPLSTQRRSSAHTGTRTTPRTPACTTAAGTAAPVRTVRSADVARPSQAWKESERRMAAALGGVRVPITGRARGSAPDIAHDRYAIEHKWGRVMSSRMVEAVEQAEAAAADAAKHGKFKTPLVTIENVRDGKRENGKFVLMRLEDFLELTAEDE